MIERAAAVRSEVEHHFGPGIAWVVPDQTGAGDKHAKQAYYGSEAKSAEQAAWDDYY